MSESEIIQRYQTVINALLPYANEGRLLEGLNKFTSRLSNKIRKVLKQEVERLMSQTYESANNSAFAVFPVRKFKHFGIDMRLDQLGEDILYKETERYFNKYTVGVLETVTSSEYYQNRLKAENQKKIVITCIKQDIKFKVPQTLILLGPCNWISKSIEEFSSASFARLAN